MSSSPSSTSTPPLASAGPSGQNTHPSVENNDEKNRYDPIASPCVVWQVESLDLTINYLSVVIKVGMVGDSQIGKTSLMVKYVEGSFDEDYIQTLGSSSFTPHTPSFNYFYFYTQASISWKRLFLFAELPSRFQYGTWAGSESLWICCLLFVTMLSLFCSCLICRENQRWTQWRSGIAKHGDLTRFSI